MAKLLRVANQNRCIGCYACMQACARLQHQSYSLTKSAVQIQAAGGLGGELTTKICHGCTEPACAAACPARALTERPGGGVKFAALACTGCGSCVQACPVQHIRRDIETLRPIVCVQCGACARFCPHHVLTMEEVNGNA